jgi:serine phosphatase RsbU (regulator of sigma subunit)
LEWAAALKPAGRIGGDFYDFVRRSDGTWVVLVADVSGKGIPAAMALTMLRSTFRTFAREGATPAELARRLSEAFYDEWLGTPYVTCIIARFESGSHTLTYTNAGHPPGLVLSRSARRYLSCGGFPLGLLQEAVFEEETLVLEAGDTLVMVTDGITEALEDSARAPIDIITEQVRKHRQSARAVCHTVMSLALQGKGPAGVEHWEDDRTVVVATVRHRPPALNERAEPAGGAHAFQEPTR